MTLPFLPFSPGWIVGVQALIISHLNYCSLPVSQPSVSCVSHFSSMLLVLPQLRAAMTTCWVKSKLLHMVVKPWHSLAPSLLALLRTTSHASCAQAFHPGILFLTTVSISCTFIPLFLCTGFSSAWSAPSTIPTSSATILITAHSSSPSSSNTSVKNCPPQLSQVEWLACSLFCDLCPVHISVTFCTAVCFILRVTVSCELHRNKADS